MNQYSVWRYLLLVVLIVAGIIYALPNLYGDDPAIQIASAESLPITIKTVNKVKTTLRSQGIAYQSMSRLPQSILIRLSSSADQLKAQDVLQATLGSNFSVALNLAPRTPKWLLAVGARPMKLGLDLRGGIHFLMDVDVEALVKLNQEGDMHKMAVELRHQQLRYSHITGLGRRGIAIYFQTSAAADQAARQLRSKFPEYAFDRIDNSSQLRATLLPSALAKLRNYAVDQNLSILRTRVNELGVAEPVIQRQGLNQISVDLPGIQDTARARNIIGKVATVRWQLVDTEHDAMIAARTGVVPFGSQLYQFEGRPVLIKSRVILKGSSITNAASIADENGQPAVSVRVSGSGDSIFNRITAANVGKPLAVVYVETKTIKKLVDGKVITTHRQLPRVINIATIQSALGNNFQITGLQSMQYAKNLALLLRSGAYPVPVSIVQERVVGPSLGKENIHMGVLSTEIGSILVILFMVLYYRLFGIVADMALILNIIFIVAVQSIIGATLTLPGIAAIVLTVGMAVDANVLINERIREELRLGMSPQAAIHAGYARAFTTIVDSNVTTLIVAVVLVALGSGPVKGFAITLIIGLLMSMITAIFFTRAVINLIYGKRNVSHLSIGIKVRSQ